MSTPTLLPTGDGLHILQVTSTADKIVIDLAVVATSAVCPVCHHASARVHSRYRRTLADLPWSRIAVQINVQARKFFCDQPGCCRRIFTEPLPDLAARYARKTTHLHHALYLVGYALGGEAGARLAVSLGLLVSPNTLLRRLRQRAAAPTSASVSAVSAPTPVRVLGVDDFAFRKGQRYGTILVDLERRCVLDLLPDRTAESLTAWLKAHPEVQVISRDRANAYSEAAKAGAPQAKQVADRWHLLKNIADRLEDVVSQEKKALGAAAQRAYAPAPAPPLAPNYQQRERQATLQRRQARLDTYQEFFAQNAHLSVKEQIKAAGVSRNTYYKWLNRKTLPPRKPLPRRDRLIDAFIPYLQSRWEAGCQKGATLFKEIQAQGFSGTSPTVDYLLREWRKEGRPSKAPEPLRRPSPREAVWFLLKPAAQLTSRQQQFTQALLELSPRLHKAQELALAFFTLVRKRDVDALDAWLASVEQSDILPLRACLGGMHKDKAAIVAALSCEWSNGQVEGQVNRLKLVKRSMYGRANFALLRARVLPTQAA